MDYAYQLYQEKKTRQKTEIRLWGCTVGLSLVVYVCLSNLISIVMVSIPYTKDLLKDTLFQYSYQILVSFISILLPFCLFGNFAKKRMHTDTELLNVGLPTAFSDMALAIPAGLAFCIFSNYLTNYFVQFFMNTGVELTAPELMQPSDGESAFLYLLYVTVSAAVLEETVLRGIVMQPLIKYGKGFAVVVSAVIFGLMHGNFVQAPFAFLVGLSLGYFTIITDTMWTSVCIHALNNAYSAFMTMLSEALDTKSFILCYYVINFVVLFSGILCFWFLIKKRKTVRMTKEKTIIKKGRFSAYFINLPMLVAIAMILYISITTVNLKG